MLCHTHPLPPQGVADSSFPQSYLFHNILEPVTMSEIKVLVIVNSKFTKNRFRSSTIRNKTT